MGQGTSRYDGDELAAWEQAQNATEGHLPHVKNGREVASRKRRWSDASSSEESEAPDTKEIAPPLRKSPPRRPRELTLEDEIDLKLRPEELEATVRRTSEEKRQRRLAKQERKEERRKRKEEKKALKEARAMVRDADVSSPRPKAPSQPHEQVQHALLQPREPNDSIDNLNEAAPQLNSPPREKTKKKKKKKQKRSRQDGPSEDSNVEIPAPKRKRTAEANEDQAAEVGFKSSPSGACVDDRLAPHGPTVLHVASVVQPEVLGPAGSTRSTVIHQSSAELPEGLSEKQLRKQAKQLKRRQRTENSNDIQHGESTFKTAVPSSSTIHPNQQKESPVGTKLKEMPVITNQATELEGDGVMDVVKHIKTRNRMHEEWGPVGPRQEDKIEQGLEERRPETTPAASLQTKPPRIRSLRDYQQQTHMAAPERRLPATESKVTTKASPLLSQTRVKTRNIALERSSLPHGNDTGVQAPQYSDSNATAVASSLNFSAFAQSFLEGAQVQLSQLSDNGRQAATSVSGKKERKVRRRREPQSQVMGQEPRSIKKSEKQRSRGVDPTITTVSHGNATGALNLRPRKSPTLSPKPLSPSSLQEPHQEPAQDNGVVQHNQREKEQDTVMELAVADKENGEKNISIMPSIEGMGTADFVEISQGKLDTPTSDIAMLHANEAITGRTDIEDDEKVRSEPPESPVPDSELGARAASEELGEEHNEAPTDHRQSISLQARHERSPSWSIDQYEAVLEAASRYLLSLPENKHKKVTINDLRADIDENPTLSQWIAQLEQAGLSFERSAFLEALQAVAPVDGSAEVEVEKQASSAQRTTLESDRSGLVLNYLAEQLLKVPDTGLLPCLQMYLTHQVCHELGIRSESPELHPDQDVGVEEAVNMDSAHHSNAESIEINVAMNLSNDSDEEQSKEVKSTSVRFVRGAKPRKPPRKNSKAETTSSLSRRKSMRLARTRGDAAGSQSSTHEPGQRELAQSGIQKGDQAISVPDRDDTTTTAVQPGSDFPDLRVHVEDLATEVEDRGDDEERPDISDDDLAEVFSLSVLTSRTSIEGAKPRINVRFSSTDAAAQRLQLLSAQEDILGAFRRALDQLRDADMRTSDVEDVDNAEELQPVDQRSDPVNAMPKSSTKRQVLLRKNERPEKPHDQLCQQCRKTSKQWYFHQAVMLWICGSCYNKALRPRNVPDVSDVSRRTRTGSDVQPEQISRKQWSTKQAAIRNALKPPKPASGKCPRCSFDVSDSQKWYRSTRDNEAWICTHCWHKDKQIRPAIEPLPGKPSNGVCQECHKVNKLGLVGWYYQMDSNSWICKLCYNDQQRKRRKESQKTTATPSARNTPRPEDGICTRCGLHILIYNWKWDNGERRWICASCFQRDQRARSFIRQVDGEASDDTSTLHAHPNEPNVLIEQPGAEQRNGQQNDGIASTSQPQNGPLFDNGVQGAAAPETPGTDMDQPLNQPPQPLHNAALNEQIRDQCMPSGGSGVSDPNQSGLERNEVDGKGLADCNMTKQSGSYETYEESLPHDCVLHSEQKHHGNDHLADRNSTKSASNGEASSTTSLGQIPRTISNRALMSGVEELNDGGLAITDHVHQHVEQFIDPALLGGSRFVTHEADVDSAAEPVALEDNVSRPMTPAYQMCFMCNVEPGRWHRDDALDGWLCHSCYGKELGNDGSLANTPAVSDEYWSPEPFEGSDYEQQESQPSDDSEDEGQPQQVEIQCHHCDAPMHPKREQSRQLIIGGSALRTCKRCSQRLVYHDKMANATKAAKEGWTDQVRMSRRLRQVMDQNSHDPNNLLIVLRDKLTVDWWTIQEILARSEGQVDSVYKLKQRYHSLKQEQARSASSVD